MYSLFVMLGIGLAVLIAWRQPRRDGYTPDQRQTLRLAAIIGAIVGAYLLELPADLLGWTAPPPPGLEDLRPLGGRTVLGGLLGGWIAVEFAKWRRGLRQPSGDAFALPLAAALACGRLGCAFAGCCAGAVCEGEPWWTWRDAHGQARFPVQLAETAFHALVAIVIAICLTRGWGRGRLLAGYLAAYGLLRFALEGLRLHPPVLGPLTWYQVLALALVGLAGGTWWARRPRSMPPSLAGSDANVPPGHA